MSLSIRHIGVLDSPFTVELKRQLLLFDELAIPDLLGRVGSVSNDSLRADLEWLGTQGLVSEFDYRSFRIDVLAPGRHSLDGVIRQMAGSYMLIQTAASAALPNEDPDGFDAAIDLGLGGFIVSTLRSIATELESETVRASPVIPRFAKATPEAILADWRTIFRRTADVLERRSEIERALETDEDRELFDLGCRGIVSAAQQFSELGAGGIELTSEPTDVLSITLRALPSVAASVSLEEVADFVRDPSSIDQRRRLHRWMRQLAAGEVNVNEVVDEFADLTASYRDHMTAAKLEHGASSLEVILSIPATLLGNLTQQGFGAAAAGLFTLRRAKAHLMRAEIEAPGREVAYLVRAEERFGDTRPRDG